MSYESLNFLSTDELLTEEQLQVRDSVRQFVNQEAQTLIGPCHREERFPKELVPKMASLGLLGMTLKGYDCAGLDSICYGLAMEELERCDSSLRSFASVQGALVMYPIYTYGSKAQKEKYLPRLARGELVGCFGLTEPDAGSNPGGLKTKAQKTSGGYILNGNKMWITNGCLSDVAVVWAKAQGKIRGFILEKDQYTTTLMKGKFSLRASITSELHFKDTFVREDQVLPEALGLKAALSCLTQARYGIAWGVLGAANACYQTALDYSKTREIFSRAQASYQLVQAKLVHMLQEITKGQLLALRLGQLKDSGKLTPEQVSLGKMNNCRMALDIARLARDILGANGILDEYPVIRHMLNLETVNTYEGTEDIHRLILGEKITGISAIK